MKIGVDSYCYHRYFGEVYNIQDRPEKTNNGDFYALNISAGTSLQDDDFSDAYIIIQEFLIQ